MKNKIKFYNIILVAFTILTLISINYSYGFGTMDFVTGGQSQSQSQSQGESVKPPKPNMGGGLDGGSKKDEEINSSEATHSTPEDSFNPGGVGITNPDGTIDHGDGNGHTSNGDKTQDEIWREEAEKGDQAGSDAIHKNDTIYQAPKKDSQTNASDSLDDMMKDADSFVTQGNLQYDQSKLVNFSQNVYNIALTIGTVIAVLMGSILGIKFMMGSAEEKADTKKLLLAYVVGCIIVFGGFGIWKIVTTILSNM